MTGIYILKNNITQLHNFPKSKSLRAALFQAADLSNKTSVTRYHTTPFVRRKKGFDEVKGNPYFEKYAEKITTLQKTSPEEFLRRMELTEQTSDKFETSHSVSQTEFGEGLTECVEMKRAAEKRLGNILDVSCLGFRFLIFRFNIRYLFLL